MKYMLQLRYTEFSENGFFDHSMIHQGVCKVVYCGDKLSR